MDNNLITWNPDDIVQVKLKKNNDFYKVKETLQRIGIPSYAKKELYQTCHIWKDNGRYYIVHFKELFGLDGRSVTITDQDIKRRNLIIGLMQEWDLVKVVHSEMIEKRLSINYIKILPYKEKNNWKLMPKYRFKKYN